MKAFDRLKQAAQVFKQAIPEGSGWFDGASPECQEADRLLQMGRYADAEAIFERIAADNRPRAFGRKQQTRVLLALATAQFKQDKLAEAERTASNARSQLDDRHPGSELVDCLELQGRIAQKLGNIETAQGLLQQAVENQKRLREPDPTTLTKLQRCLATILTEAGWREDARDTLREAVVIAETQCGEYTRVTADCLIDLSHSEAGLGRFAEARELAERALKIHRSVCGTDSAEAGQDLETLAGFCQSNKELEAAVSYLEQALFVRERQIGGNAAQFALLLMALADIYTLIGRLAPALELMQQAVTKLSPSRDENLAAALEKLGSIYFRTGRPENAFDCYRNARQYWELKPEENSEAISANGRFLEELARLLPEPKESAGHGGPEDELDDGRSVLLSDGPAPSNAGKDPAHPKSGTAAPPASAGVQSSQIPGPAVPHTPLVLQVIPGAATPPLQPSGPADDSPSEWTPVVSEGLPGPAGPLIVPADWTPITSQVTPGSSASSSGSAAPITSQTQPGTPVSTSAPMGWTPITSKVMPGSRSSAGGSAGPMPLPSQSSPGPGSSTTAPAGWTPITSQMNAVSPGGAATEPAQLAVIAGENRSNAPEAAPPTLCGWEDLAFNVFESAG